MTRKHVPWWFRWLPLTVWTLGMALHNATLRGTSMLLLAYHLAWRVDCWRHNREVDRFEQVRDRFFRSHARRPR